MKGISDILASSFMPLEGKVIHQIHEFEKKKWSPMAQHILLNQRCRIQEDFLEEVMAVPKKVIKRGQVGVDWGRYNSGQRKQHVEIPGGKRKHGPLDERQEILHGWHTEGEREGTER